MFMPRGKRLVASINAIFGVFVLFLKPLQLIFFEGLVDVVGKP